MAPPVSWWTDTQRAAEPDHQTTLPEMQSLLFWQTPSRRLCNKVRQFVIVTETKATETKATAQSLPFVSPRTAAATSSSIQTVANKIHSCTQTSAPVLCGQWRQHDAGLALVIKRKSD